MKYIITILTLVLIGISCTEIEYNVDPIFEPYVEDFTEEARKNGLDIDLREEGITIELSDVAQVDVSGRCFTGLNQRRIVINKAAWLGGFEDFKRRLMFHELGHCVLGRGHRNEKFSNGIWKSSMHGSPLTEEELRTAIPYYGFRKAYYDAELFDETIPDPDWANATFDINEVDEQQKEMIVEEQEINRFSKVFSQDIEDYEIHTSFFFEHELPNLTVLLWESDMAKYQLRMGNGLYYLVVSDDENTEWSIFGGINAVNFSNASKVSLTIRRQDDLEKLFINDKFIFHFDALPGSLKTVRFDSTLGNNRFNENLHIEEFSISRLTR